VIARLTALRGGDAGPLDPAIESLLRELDPARARAKGLRGDARQVLIARLHDLDRALLDAARAHLSPAVLHQLADEAEEELAPFRLRLAPEAYARSRAAAIDRLIREHLRLPVIEYR
jgi:hypothetical protein